VLNFPGSSSGTITVYNSGGGVISTNTITGGNVLSLSSGGAYFIVT
jgi:hypothetical protein